MSSVFSPDCLQGKVLLITGASSGLGRATAETLAGCGARLVLSGRDAARLEATRAGLSGSGHVAATCDFSDADAVAEWAKAQADSVGGLDGFFHAAGTELVRPVRMTKTKDLHHIFDSSFTAAMGLARAAGQKGTLRDGASLVFMSSVSAHRGTSGMTAYSAAKAAVEGLTRSLACELATRAIRVNAIAAGAVKSEMHDRLLKNLGEASAAQYEQRHLLGFGEAQDVAQMATYLFTDAARWITGSTVVVDGGYLVK